MKMIPFSFEKFPVRVADKDGEPWFVAKDVCEALGLGHHRSAIEKLDSDEKGVALIHSLGGDQETAIVSESGLYAIALRCRDAMTPGSVAHRFRKWVTADVLPTIRKTGGYGAVPAAFAAALEANAKAITDLADAFREQRGDIAELKRRLDEADAKRVEAALGERRGGPGRKSQCDKGRARRNNLA